MKTQVLLSAAVLGVALSGCGKHNSNPIEAIKQTKNTAELQGKNFEADCSGKVESLGSMVKHFVTGGGTTQVRSYREAIQFQADRVKTTKKFYDRSDCGGNVAFEVVEAGPFQVTADNNGTKELQINFDDQLVRVQNDQLVKDWNSSSRCGIKDWSKGAERSIKDASCADLKSFDAQEKRTVKLDGTTLTWKTGNDVRTYKSK